MTATGDDTGGNDTGGNDTGGNDTGRGAADRRLERLRGLIAPVTLAAQRTLPLADALVPLLPTDGLPRGAVVRVEGAVGATSLALALVAAASRHGSWVACAGLAGVCWEAAVEVGVDPGRVLVVDPAPRQRATALSALLDAVDVVVCGPAAVPGPGARRRLRALMRERGAVLVDLGAAPTAWAPDVRLRVEGVQWQGIGAGWGRLTTRTVLVAVEGRGRVRPGHHEVHFAADGSLQGSRAVASHGHSGQVAGPVAPNEVTVVALGTAG